MNAKLLLLGLPLLFAAIAFAAALLLFYRGGYEPPDTAVVAYERIAPPAGIPAAAPDTALNRPAVAPARRGVLAIDAQHGNAFTETEILALTDQVAARGYDVEYLGDAGALGLSYSPSALLIQAAAPDAPPHESPADTRLYRLEQALRRADSLAVILPREPYSEAETALIERFVRRGGRLLLLSDPSRPQRINTLAANFGLDFQPDYLYDLSANDLNFRRILLSDFQPGELTAGLETVVLPAAGSIRSSGPGAATAGANTRSSLRPPTDNLNPIAWGENRNVLAVADITFMIPPNNALADNGRLISNIAGFLTGGRRDFALADFPNFYRPGRGVDILLGRPELWDAGLRMKNGLSSYRIEAGIAAAENPARDAVFLGLYDDAPQIAHRLQTAGVRVDGGLAIPGAPELALDGAAVFLLSPGPGRHALTVLADTPATLAAAVDALFSGAFRGGLVGEFTGIRQSMGAGR